MARKSMLERLGNRQDIIDAMVPVDFPVGCRRPTPGTGFLEALQQPNVRLASGDIARVDSTGIIRDTGEHIELDVIICCTGLVNLAPYIHLDNLLNPIRKQICYYLPPPLPSECPWRKSFAQDWGFRQTELLGLGDP